ncbi:hypothetical protein JET14_09330 [Martelella lutilitoris]|uniref:Uncharacterized protein n=1 Tax=Martelella lutilitoris TaxID=2583532 RepID=A0A7T7HNC9_9HYPH|nr:MULTISPECIES: hypothetical protein [Martelella]MAM12981.1 hypothetical protein [Rhizobiaceae bacterium]QQM32309.1 hypothetical protein JET14_09330 [Martelella lutilitoris]|tara:strand:+ start:600 stop:953 length:354 start_codon:yes stop_codon:yes gene_type:complete
MKLFLATAMLLAAAGSATAQEPINRYDIQDMTCNQVHGILDREGAAILRYPSPSGSGRILYDRYVDSPTICFGQGGHAVQRVVPTRDTKGCPTLSCRPGPPECDTLGFDMFYCDNDN